jgi:hypothetical protein
MGPVRVGVTEGYEVQAGAGEEAFEERGPVLHPFQPGLHQGGQLGEVAFGRVGQGSLEMRPERLDWIQLVRVPRQLADGQPVPGRGQPGHRGADVRVQIVPDEHDRAGELLMGRV